MKRFLFLAALCVLATSLSAATHVWTGASSERFSDAGNWTGGSPAGDTEAELIFPAGAVRFAAVNDLQGLRVRSLHFTGDAFTLGGNPLVVTSDLSTSSLAAVTIANDLLVDAGIR
jgi:hypothetical protein